MSRRNKEGGFDKPKVPAYLVSFSDMMTILLTFFILLNTYASEKQAGFISDAIGSFRLAIEAMGLPGFLPADTKPVVLRDDMVSYRTKQVEDAEEVVRRLQQEIEHVRNAKVDAEKPNDEAYRGLYLRFERGTAKLVPGSERTLAQLAAVAIGAGTLPPDRRRSIELIGHADREDLSEPARMDLALRRACVVVRRLVRSYGAPARVLIAGARGTRRERRGDGDVTVRIARPIEVNR